MKLRYLFAVVAILAMASCASTEKSGTANLDAAIQQASKKINDTLPAGTKVALLNFTSGSDVLSDYVIEEMSIALVDGKKLIVVDRKEIDLIRGEMNFQMSGEVSDESAQEIGKLLGAQSIVSGSLVNMGDTHRFRTKVINVISAAIETSSSISVANDSQIQFLLSQRKSPAPQTAQSGTRAAPAQAGTSNQAQPAAPSPAPAQPATPAEPAAPVIRVYKIGDTGPAGGLIFYDKGNNNNGWRYLEAAPVEGESVARWRVSSNTKVDNTSAAIGSGKRNTQLIVEVLSKTSGEWDNAAQKADDLVLNGFDDWFLPSKDELDQMYGNLKRKNLGGFKNEDYWSSTIQNDSTHYQSFGAGSQSSGYSTSRSNVRPIRQVPGPNTARSSVDDNSGIAGATTGTTGTKRDAGTTTQPKTNGMGVLTTIGGILVIGGLVAFVIWGPRKEEAVGMNAMYW